MRTAWILLLFGSIIIHHCFTNVSGEGIPSGEAAPSYSQCKPYVDAALKGEIPPEESPPAPPPPTPATSTDTAKAKSVPPGGADDDNDSSEEEGTKKPSPAAAATDDDDSSEEDVVVKVEEDDGSSSEEGDAHPKPAAAADDDDDDDSKEEAAKAGKAVEGDDDDDSKEEAGAGEAGKEVDDDDESSEEAPFTGKAKAKQEETKAVDDDDDDSSEESAEKESAGKAGKDSGREKGGRTDSVADKTDKSKSGGKKEKEDVEKEQTAAKASKLKESKPKEEDGDDDDSSEEDAKAAAAAAKKGKKAAPVKKDVKAKEEEDDDDSSEEDDKDKKPVVKGKEKKPAAKGKEEDDDDDDSEEDDKAAVAKKGKKEAPAKDKKGGKGKEEDDDDSDEDDDSKEDDKKAVKGKEKKEQPKGKADAKEDDDDSDESGEDGDGSDESDEEEEEPYIPRPRDHLTRILGLDKSAKTRSLDAMSDKITQGTLKELKQIYENAIKPLETMYKYRDLSNRHYGDSEIFSKPMVVFMGPWSGGKSTIINWLLGIQNEEHALRTGADPSPAQFNIMVWGEEEEILDGTQLAADWTFSGLQKFGQSYLDRLRGRKLPNRLLEKVNLVEIPGILEIRKQVERSFPFNDACQWFIDRADVLFLVYDPAKLDIGPETEAILDQLKGRENQVRIILNKADSVRADELLRVQATLVWNISPLMASAEPPILYAASLWDHPLQPDSPTALLRAHENQFLKDINDANEKRVETRIAAARRFAVRVRNHAKMVDCYLNTYNNHRSFFSNKKRIADDIVEHPQNYHIYEGLSTLTNISRYDLPDPDTYRDFFKLNPLWEFPTLASTCTYFRGCPINKLDIAIAYDLPELLGRYRRQRESIGAAGGVPAGGLGPQQHTPTPTPSASKPGAAPTAKPGKEAKAKPLSKEELAKQKAEAKKQKEEEQELKKWNKWWKDGIPHPVRSSDTIKPVEQTGNKWWKDGVPQTGRPVVAKKDEDDGKPKKNKWWKDGVPQR